MTLAATWWRRVVKGFARFWWDFLVGETPELFVAVLVLVGLVALCRDVGHSNTTSLILLPLACVAALGLSLLRAERASRRK